MSETVPTQPGRSCAYCGEPGDLTDDHVPPATVFPKPRPASLVTVPACRPCNGGASKDDEHFRMMLCFSQDVGESPEAQKNWAPILRSLKYPQARGMKKALFQSIRPVQAMTWGGIHLGTRMGFEVDMERIRRVIERTVRGLYFHELKRRPPDGYGVLVHCDETLTRLPPGVLEEMQQKIILPVAQVQPKIIAPGVFSYRFLVAKDDPQSAVLGLTFYERKSFLGIVAPANPSTHPEAAG